MKTYKLCAFDSWSIFSLEGDEVISIYKDPNNTLYQEYLEWLAEGNEPLPADEL